MVLHVKVLGPAEPIIHLEGRGTEYIKYLCLAHALVYEATILIL